MRFWKKLSFSGKKNLDAPPKSSAVESAKIEKKLGYKFNNRSLLELALTHPSYNLKKSAEPNNQRLEFLGDSILGAILSSELYELFPEQDEGALSRKKAIFARGAHLAELASSLELNNYIKMSHSERSNDGHLRPSTLEDVMEAVIGAVYLDGGYHKTMECLLRWMGNLKSRLEMQKGIFNPKGRLQEFIQSQKEKESIKYLLIHEKGPGHARQFVVELRIAENKVAEGTGKTKKDAEEKAAEYALKILSEKK